jgi:hypothetical protein
MRVTSPLLALLASSTPILGTTPAPNPPQGGLRGGTTVPVPPGPPD